MKRILFTVFASFMLLFTSPAMMNAQASSADTLISNAKKYMGTPYRWGGTRPGGFDCSGYTQYVFRETGVNIPRTTRQQINVGTPVAKSQLKTGDLVFFNTSGRGVSHVGIYISGGKFIHASTSKGVTIGSIYDPYYWGKRYIGARRVKNFEPKPVVDPHATRAEVAAVLAKDLNLSATTTASEQTAFPDVPKNHPHYEAIIAAAAAGIFNGGSDGNFNPNATITRGELARTLVNTFGLKGTTDKVFPDVPDTHPHATQIKILAANNVTQGYPNGNFGPNDKIKLVDVQRFINNLNNNQ